MGECIHDKDIFGNDVTYGPDGEKYVHGKDILGTDVTYGPSGEKYVHGKDIFGTDATYGPSGEKYVHGKDIFGTDVIYGPNGEQYIHSKDIFGHGVTYEPESEKDGPERDPLNPGFGVSDVFTDDLRLYGGIAAYTPRKQNTALMYESAESKHDSGYFSKRRDSLQRGEKIVLDIVYYDGKDYDKRNQCYDELRKYDAEDFTAMKTHIGSALNLISANKSTTGYIKGKGWPLARRYRLWTYYPDKDRHTNVDDIKEVIYFLKEDGNFAVYTYADECTRYYSGGESHECQGEDLVLKNCPMEEVVKALDFDFYAYERSDRDYQGEDHEWIQSSTLLGEFGSNWRGASQLVIRKYPQKGMGLIRVLRALAGSLDGDFREPAQAYAVFNQIEKTLQARKIEKQRKDILAAKERERIVAEGEYDKRLEQRKKETKRAYWVSVALNILVYAVAILSGGRGGDWRIFAGCAVIGAFAYSYLDGLNRPYSYFLSTCFSNSLYATFGTICLMGIVLFFVSPSGRGINEDVAAIFFIMLAVLVVGQIITFTIGVRISKRISLPKGTASQHSGNMTDIYIVYIMMVLAAAVCIFVFGPTIPDGIYFWRLVF